MGPRVKPEGDRNKELPAGDENKGFSEGERNKVDVGMKEINMARSDGNKGLPEGE
jgi:hypothetical protein